jgi:hypothetical protein
MKLMDLGLNANPIGIFLWIFGIRKKVELWITENVLQPKN